MTTVQEYLEILEEMQIEMAHVDPHKWLGNIEIEDIPETIETLENEIERLEEPHSFVGSEREYKHFIKRIENRIEYLNECIEILQDVWNDSVEGGDNE